jgi:hypothetical protein
MPTSLTIVLSALVVLGRFVIEPRLDLPTLEGSYEAFSHLYVGGLFGFWWARRGHISERVYADGLRALILAVGLSLFELAMFIYQKFLS